ncbi:MAG TPA: sigma-70 family RNA polymerase sigma factor [Terriglobales bacterium]|nr:sigma-70 family RNA polymerase sigma factor [Terriglobales bacterium]
MTDQIERLMRQAERIWSLGVVARQQGAEATADAHFREAFGLALEAVNQATVGGSHPVRLDALRVAARFALDCGEVMEARRLMDEAFSAEASTKFAEEWVQLGDVTAWPDTWLIAAVRRDPPDVQALDALANRYWKPLFGRCQLLTGNHQKASDLAQEAWCRVLRTRHALKSGGNFPAYLTTIATNLWRDSYRSAQRAGPMADHRVESLDAAYPNEDGESVALVDRIPDLKALSPEDQTLLAMDIDEALEQLTPQLRDVLVARFITGESCAEIGQRYGRTEQSISGWVRQALRDMKLHLEAASRGAATKA